MQSLKYELQRTHPAQKKILALFHFIHTRNDSFILFRLPSCLYEL